MQYLYHTFIEDRYIILNGILLKTRLVCYNTNRVLYLQATVGCGLAITVAHHDDCQHWSYETPCHSTLHTQPATAQQQKLGYSLIHTAPILCRFDQKSKQLDTQVFSILSGEKRTNLVCHNSCVSVQPI